MHKFENLYNNELSSTVNTRYSNSEVFNKSYRGFSDFNADVMQLKWYKASIFTQNTIKSVCSGPQLLGFLKVFFVLLTLFLFVSLTTNSTRKNCSKYTKLSILTTNEFGLFFDMLVFFLLFLTATTLLFANSFSFTTQLFGYNHAFLAYVLILITVVIQLPIQFIFNVSIFLLTNIKGNVKKSNKLVIILEDLVGFTTYNIRYLLQLVRWFMSLISLFMLNEYFYEVNITTPGIFTEGTFILTISNILLSTTRVVLEYIDLFFILSVQLTAFLAILF